MKKSLIVITLVLIAAFAKAQEQSSTTVANDTTVYTNVDHFPEYPGGLDKLYQLIGTNIRYPENARKSGKQGRVFVMFVVEKGGAVGNFKILRSVSADLDAESIRVLKLSPKWKPALKADKIVRGQYVIPISFVLPKN